MPSGSVPLLEAAKCGTDTLKRGFVEVLIQESPLMEQLPWMTVSGNALQHSEEVSLPSPEFRQVNATYSRSFGTDTSHFWGTCILGGEVFVDNYLVRVRGNAINVKARQYQKYAKAVSRTFDKYFFDGTGTANDFKGVNTLVSEGFGQRKYAGNGAADGSALTLADLDICIDSIRGQFSPDVIWANRFQRRKITSLARTTYYSLIDIGTDVFGKQVTQYDGIPIRIIGDDINGTAILGFDETRGNSSVTSSLYIASLDMDEGVTGLMGLGGTLDVKDFGETEAAPGHLGRVEFYPGIAIFNQYAIVRLAGILES